MQSETSSCRVEVDVVADDARVRNALTALVNATPALNVHASLSAAEALAAPPAPDRIVLCDLDSTPSTLLPLLIESGAWIIALGQPRQLPSASTVVLIDKGAAPDAITTALQEAASYVIGRDHQHADVAEQCRRPPDARHTVGRRSSPQR